MRQQARVIEFRGRATARNAVQIEAPTKRKKIAQGKRRDSPRQTRRGNGARGVEIPVLVVRQHTS